LETPRIGDSGESIFDYQYLQELEGKTKKVSAIVKETVYILKIKKSMNCPCQGHFQPSKNEQKKKQNKSAVLHFLIR
jgi:hypothetical protein